ncbi:hypothetical protein [Cereibacter sphaeroides]|uniref:hypothetical protein n=1 Tax=Cereibacter sphaeroides TaxID=1063 RepID=UPI003FCD08F1
MAYMFGIIVFLAMLAVCWFGFMAAERQAGRLHVATARSRDAEPAHGATPSAHQDQSPAPAAHRGQAAATQSSSAQRIMEADTSTKAGESNAGSSAAGTSKEV